MRKFALVLLFLPVMCFGMERTVDYYGAAIPKKYYDELVSLCVDFKVPIVYAARLIEWESKWDEKSNTKNANDTWDRGIMKLNSAYLDDFALRYNKGKKIDPYDWKVSMRVGIQHLATMRKHTGSWFGAVAAYNMGLTAYTEWRKGTRNMQECTKLELEYVFG